MRFFPEPPTRTRNLAAVPGWALAGTGYLLVTLLLAFPLVFHPSPHVLSYSEHLFGLSLLSTPVYWLTGSPVIAYNVAFLLTFPLSGLAAYLLMFELTGRRDASWLAGLDACGPRLRGGLCTNAASRRRGAWGDNPPGARLVVRKNR